MPCCRLSTLLLVVLLLLMLLVLVELLMMDGGVTAIGEDMGGDEDDAGTVVLKAEGDVYAWRQFDCCFGD